MHPKVILLFLFTCMVFVSAYCNTDTIQPAGKTELHVLTYNIKFLPAILLGQHHHPIVRAKYIPQALFDDTVDVVIFEEAFDETARRKLIHKLRKEFPYIIGPANAEQPSFKFCSGVFIASRYPIKMLGEVKYKDCVEADCMARKGALIGEVTLPIGRKIQIIGTHIQAPGDDTLKRNQFFQLKGLMNQYKSAGVPQLVCGDFNACRADTPLYNMMIRIVKGLDGPITGEQQTSSDHEHNDMEHYDANDHNLVDYLLYCYDQPPIYTERRIIKYQHKWGRKHKDLSDHYGVKLKLVF